MTTKKIFGNTPNGGIYSVITYLDRKGNEVEENIAERCVIREFGENDEMIAETFGGVSN